jgi:hypothetical protein
LPLFRSVILTGRVGAAWLVQDRMRQWFRVSQEQALTSPRIHQAAQPCGLTGVASISASESYGAGPAGAAQDPRLRRSRGRLYDVLPE